MLKLNTILFSIALMLGTISSTCWSTPEQEAAIAKILMESKEIKASDDKLNQLYRYLTAMLSPSEAEALKTDQQAWLVKRNELLVQPEGELADALADFYQDRNKQLAEQAWTHAQKTFDLFINGKPTLDFKDPTLHQALEACPFNACKAYKALIDYENSGRTAQEPLQTLLAIYETFPKNFNCNIGDLGATLKEDPLKGFLSILSYRELFRDAPAPPTPAKKWEDHPHATPVWLVLKYPEAYFAAIEDITPSIIPVRADFSISKLPAFQELNALAKEMETDPYYQTSYSYGPGTIVRLRAAFRQVALDKLSFAPLLNPPGPEASAQQILCTQKAWSLQGLWNRTMYTKFITAFDQATVAAKDYYETHDQHAAVPHAAYHLARFCELHDKRGEASKAFQAIHGAGGDFTKLQELTQGFEPKDWDELLHMAILAELPLTTLQWIITSGAHVNAPYGGETCLMNAANKPEVLKFLLDQGADIHAKNGFGKTALFYAVQFGDTACVSALLERGAHVNDPLDSLEVLSQKFENPGPSDPKAPSLLPEMVADFTPLVYALRYAPQETIDHLKAKGATLGTAPPERIKGWVLQGTTFDQATLAKRLENTVATL